MKTPIVPRGPTAGWLALLCWLVYLIVPIQGWGLIAGRPLGLLEAAALAVVCWLQFARGAVGRWAPIAIALVGKLVIGGALLLPHGFGARYYANGHFAAPLERSTEPSDPGDTRTDPRLRFGYPGAPDLPLEFFNDTRFNYYKSDEPERATLPFSVTWQGYWNVSDGEPQIVYLRTPGGVVDISIGGTYHARIDSGGDWSDTIKLPVGFHRISIAWSVAQGTARMFEAGRIVSGRREPFDGTVVFRARATPRAVVTDAAVRVIGTVVDLLLLGWLATLLIVTLSGVYRRLSQQGLIVRDALALLWIFGIAEALAFAVPTFGRMITLGGGDDWLTYETLARDIGLNGLWMRWSGGFGEGRPFYAQPLYPYFLAACHWLFGGGLFGVFFIQRLFTTLTIAALWRTAALVFDEATGLATLVVAIVLVLQKFSGWAGVLLSETLFVPLLCSWIYALVRLVRAPAVRNAVAAGVIGALATLTRSSLLLGWVLLVPALVMALPKPRRMPVLAALILSMAAVTSMATLRNWVVAHQLVLITSEGGVVLAQGNPPPAGLVIPAEHKRQYATFGFDPLTQSVIEFARQQPRAFVTGLWRKARFTLGWFETFLPGNGTSLFYIVTWMAAIGGVARLAWVRTAVPAPAATFGLLLALSHFAVVIAFLPYVYGDRLIMPLYIVLAPYVGLLVIAAARLTAGPRRETLAFALGLALLAISCARFVGWGLEVDLSVVTIATLVAGLCCVGLPTLSRWWLIAPLGYAAIVAVQLLRQPVAPMLEAARIEWLFVSLIVLARVFVSGPRLRHVFQRTLFALAALASILVSFRIAWRPVLQTVIAWPLRLGLVSSCGAAIGLGCAVAYFLWRTPDVKRRLAFVSGAGLALGALLWSRVAADSRLAMFSGRMAAYGVLGATVYAAIWVSAWWPSNGSDDTRRSTQGLLLGAFIAILFGLEPARTGYTLPVVFGLTLGSTLIRVPAVEALPMTFTAPHAESPVAIH